jgi:hypothetical protein
MPTRSRPATTTRSEHWLRQMVNVQTSTLDNAIAQAFSWSNATKIEWVSPIAKDGYAEYYDDSFLQHLGVSNLAVPLNQFWPRSGPRWDGLARTNDGKVILVEAKAYIEEGVDYTSRATATTSSDLIRQSLDAAKVAFGANKDANWQMPFYQHANRLAHLYFLHQLNGIDAYLVFLYFANAPDVDGYITSAYEWKGAIRLTNKCLGLQRNTLRKRVADIII